MSECLGTGLERVYQCPECGYRIAVNDGFLGDRAKLRCVDCGTKLNFADMIEHPSDRRERGSTYGPDPNP